MVEKQKTVVIFNAPPNSGKDCASDMMYEYFQSGMKCAFKDELYKDVASNFQIDVNDLIAYHNDRDLKDIPDLMFPKYQHQEVKQYLMSILYVLGVMINNRYLMSLGYYSSREALIHVSEDLIKPTYGYDHYGEVLASNIEQASEAFYFAPDGGFCEEVTPLLDKGYNVYIVQLERSGATFDNDSRSLLTKDDFKEYSNIKFITMDNNGTLDDLYNSITDLSFDIVLNQVQEKYGGVENEYEIVHV